MNEIKVRINPDCINDYIIHIDIDIWNETLYTVHEKTFNYARKRWEEVDDHYSIATPGPDNNTIFIRRGFAIFIYNRWKNYLDEDSKQLLLHDIYMDDNLFDDEDWKDLREDQLDVVNTMMQYRRCILQLPTGFGKTEIIARLIIACVKHKIHLLVTTGLGKVIDEIKARVWKYSPDTYLPDYWDNDSLVNIINPKGFTRSYKYNPQDSFWNKIQIVFCDEVSASTTDKSWDMYDLIENPDCQYLGSDATAEDTLGDRLDIRKDLNCIHSQNSQWVIAMFGMSWLFAKPTGYNVDIVNIENRSLRELCTNFNKQEFSESGLYRDICDYIFSNREYLKTLDYILRTYKKLFIPINDLDYIDRVIKVFKDKYRIATVTGAGYWSSEEGWIDIDRFKYLTEENRVDLVMTSSSGFKGLDFRGIPNVLLTLGVKAGIVIQFVGRVARQKNFRVVAITPGGNWKIPIYTKTNIKQLQLILNYYSECNINFIEDRYE